MMLARAGGLGDRGSSTAAIQAALNNVDITRGTQASNLWNGYNSDRQIAGQGMISGLGAAYDAKRAQDFAKLDAAAAARGGGGRGGGGGGGSAAVAYTPTDTSYEDWLKSLIAGLGPPGAAPVYKAPAPYVPTPYVPTPYVGGVVPKTPFTDLSPLYTGQPKKASHNKPLKGQGPR